MVNFEGAATFGDRPGNVEVPRHLHVTLKATRQATADVNAIYPYAVRAGGLPSCPNPGDGRVIETKYAGSVGGGCASDHTVDLARCGCCAFVARDNGGTETCAVGTAVDAGHLASSSAFEAINTGRKITCAIRGAADAVHLPRRSSL